MRIVLSLSLVAVTATVAGCADVAPWQRARLAHPSMTEQSESPARTHMVAVQEGAVGGSVSASSGCGCN